MEDSSTLNPQPLCGKDCSREDLAGGLAKARAAKKK